MSLKLPRPYRRAPKLPLAEALALDCLQSFAADDGLCMHPACDLLVTHLSITPTHADNLLGSLISRHVILLSAKHFAILSPLSRALKKERDRNRHRALKTQSQNHSISHSPPSWSLRTRVLQLFPALRGPVDRPASYNRPAAFEALLKEHPHHHKNACPSDVEILTDACYPGELTTVLTLIEEQRSANRLPVLLFTRKAIYVGVRRAPKR
ncbi:hypothetical protein OKA05_09080 [Luteolibacter arcticus]|uniref:Uncharacterized protein n=1 Tax=Luteolibacter arcticus TaxID=1581411 RepID=A0ABT3GGG3_9BACT|nr:hypothetical protein [Luteolibacter arcticus]MCW1922705.1 hypothetical protein [Luteolibacter arcticus]